MDMNTCRLCKGTDEHDYENGRLIKYAVRHHAHAGCGLRRWGAGFFDRLRPWQITTFPYLLAYRLGFGQELEQRCAQAVDAVSGSSPRPRAVRP